MLLVIGVFVSVFSAASPILKHQTLLRLLLFLQNKEAGQVSL
jgi:hypothetical protein